jgi:zinc protease
MRNLLFLLIVLFIAVSCSGNKYQVKKETDINGFSYEKVTNDPTGLRIYTLQNGLKVYISVNKVEPRIMTFIGVRAGSNNDPEKTTGLAHYFEHLMFKGTSSYGTADWKKEKPLLDSISNLFEIYRQEADMVKRLEIYKRIDKFSIEAAQYAIPNEYDKMMSDIGARYTNAFTSNEQTAYMNDIPANQLKKWLNLEVNRFGEVALRLFHTELETVYEEFNMYQDRDQERAYTVFGKTLFPKHPMGRDVIGEPAHLKNPSMVNILNFKDTWYVPNNMVICLSGDLDMESAIVMVNETFGKIPSKPLPELPLITEDPIEKHVSKELTGPDAEMMLMGYRCGGEKSADKKFVYLISKILYNGQAGLIDIDLMQDQKILNGYCGASFESQYGYLAFMVNPKTDQTLDQTKDLILEEIEKVKKGDFPDWLIEAIANEYRLTTLRRLQDNWRAFSFLDAFVLEKDWSSELSFPDDLEKVKKGDLVAFANTYFNDNYVTVYKKKGEAIGLVKVAKPPLTPVTINRNDESAFYSDWKKIPSDTILPVFVDFKSSLKTEEIQKGIELTCMKNKENELFNQYYIIDGGKNNDLKIPVAFNYLPYIGTTKHSATELKQLLYRYGLSTNVSSGNERSQVTISGLSRNFEKGIEIMEEILTQSVADTMSYRKYAERLIKERSDAKLNQDIILWNGLREYAHYGKINPFNDVISNEDLLKINPSELTEIAGKLSTYPHRIFYYGPDEPQGVKKILNTYHKIPSILNALPEAHIYQEQETANNLVLVADYDMSQVNIIMLAKGPAFSPEVFIQSQLFNQYFGNSMASIVFQEIRESQGMAYSAWAGYDPPTRSNRAFYLSGFVGTQSDKLGLATSTMNRILNNLIENQNFLDVSRRSIRNTIASERVQREDQYFRWLSYQDLGIDYDIRKDIYDAMDKADMEGLRSFFDTYVKNKKYTYTIVGNLKDMDQAELKKLGDVKQIPLEELFGY